MDETQNTDKQQDNVLRTLFQGEASVHLLGVSLGLGICSMALGIGFFTIYLGVIWIVFRLAPYWQPAFWLTARLSRIRDIPADFHPIELPWWRLPFLVFGLGLGLLLLAAGVQILVQRGFLGQNPIWFLMGGR